MVLKLIKEMIEFADSKFFSWLEVNFEFFRNIVETELLSNTEKVKSLRWDDLIIRCEWKKDIVDYIDQNQVSSKDEILLVSVDKPCSFDV